MPWPGLWSLPCAWPQDRGAALLSCACACREERERSGVRLKEAPGMAAQPARGRFHFPWQPCGAGCLFEQPQRKPFGQRLVSNQFTSLVFKQTPTQNPCLVPGKGAASPPPGPAQCPTPTQGARGQGCRSDSSGGPLGVGASASGPRSPGREFSLCSCPPAPPPRAWSWTESSGPPRFRQWAGLGLSPRGSPSSRPSSNKNFKGSAAQGQGVSDIPPQSQLSPTDLSWHLITALVTET